MKSVFNHTITKWMSLQIVYRIYFSILYLSFDAENYIVTNAIIIIILHYTNII